MRRTRYAPDIQTRAVRDGVLGSDLEGESQRIGYHGGQHTHVDGYVIHRTPRRVLAHGVDNTLRNREFVHHVLDSSRDNWMLSRIDVDINAPAPTFSVRMVVPVHPRPQKESVVKYVVLIHSNPQPWGHPTGDYLAEFQALPQEERDRISGDFERLLTEMQEKGELVGGEALGAPGSARLYRWGEAGAAVAGDGPYSEAKEHLAGFFLIDVENQARAEEIATVFAGPGETVELRPTMWPGGDDR